MLFSIIIPIWNDEKFLAECLDSCLNQDLSPEEYEIICIDDGSTDHTPEILQDYASRFSNIRLIPKKRGIQYGYGRDLGLAEARGEFVWFVDHDDVVAPNALDEIRDAILDSDAYDRIAFPYYEFFEELTPLEKKLMREKALAPNAGDVYLTLTLWSGVIRRSFLVEHDIWPHSKRIYAAGQFWGIKNYMVWGDDNICMEECFDNGMQTKQLTGRPLYHYRRHDGSETMNLTKNNVKWREKLRFRAAMLRGYLAIQLKEQYLAERAANSRASKETTVNMILKLRKCVLQLEKMPRQMWIEGIHQLREKDLFFSRRPPEYTFSFRDYMKTRSRKEKLTPSTYAYYYFYSLAGARWYRFLTFFSRLRGSSKGLIQLYRKHKQKHIMKRGIKDAPDGREMEKE